MTKNELNEVVEVVDRTFKRLKTRFHEYNENDNTSRFTFDELEHEVIEQKGYLTGIFRGMFMANGIDFDTFWEMSKKIEQKANSLIRSIHNCRPE
jgi:hypothetical protein